MDGIFTLRHEMDKNPTDTTDLDDFEDNYQDDGNKTVGKKSVKLLIAMAKADTDSVTGIADAILKIPGTPPDAVARTIEGGTGFFKEQEIGDYLTIELRDDDNLLGLGAGTVLDTFHDLGVPTVNQGWYFPKDAVMSDLKPVVSDDPTDLPAGMYLHICGHKGVVPATPDTLYVNLHWGSKIR